MSDVTPAPVEATAPTPTDAPAQPPSEAKPPEPPKPVNPLAEVEAALKKAGGLKVKAGGKEHVIDSLEKAVRYMQRGLPVEQSLEEVARARAEVEPVKALLAQLQSGDEEQAEQALERLLDSGKLDKVAERRLRRLYEREKSMEGLSPRERELAAALEQERGAKAKLEAERKQAEERQRAANEERQVAAVREHMAQAVGEAFKQLDLGDGKLEAIALEFMKPVIRATLNAGLPLDPKALAERVGPMLEQVHKFQLKAAKQKPYMSEAVQEALKDADDETLLRFFGSDIGKRYRAALLKQIQGGGSKPAAPASPTTDAGKAPERWDPRRIL